jgi:dephospho-CoA kinase
MILVGLTGGIASGKSTVARTMVRLGLETIDADQLARDVVAPGTGGFDEVVRAFGPGIVGEDGSIDRTRLGGEVFGDEQKLRRLAEITHPRVHEELQRRLVELQERGEQRPVVLEVALLLETGLYRMVNYVIVTYCTPRQQLERLRERDGLDEEHARLRLMAQWPLIEKVPFADFLVDTSDTLDWTVRQSESLREVLAAMGEDDEEYEGEYEDDDEY